MENIKKYNISDHELEIRDFTIDDLAPTFHLGEKLFTLNKTPNLYRVWDEYEVINFFQSDSDHCITAFVDGLYAGFVLGTLIEKRKSEIKYGYLVWIGVDQNYKRMGIASNLFEEFKERMTLGGATTLMIDTQADNQAAIEFFKSKGFDSPQDHVYYSMKTKNHIQGKMDEDK
ncbi:MAG: GNAT family N-acetyltransferase [Spirochaetes bacterium]|nr:GNAT family N-acetyltransferase [Spirochaetota bacterium]